MNPVGPHPSVFIIIFTLLTRDIIRRSISRGQELAPPPVAIAPRAGFTLIKINERSDRLVDRPPLSSPSFPAIADRIRMEDEDEETAAGVRGG